MSDHPIDPTDVLTSLATAALTEAEADAAAPDAGLIFRPEWRPTPRTRSSTSQGTPGANQSLSWASIIRNQLGLQQDQPLFPPDPHVERSAPPSAYAPRPESAYAPQPESTSEPPPREDAVAELLKKNQDVFDEVINHPFPRALGKGTASLDGFRYYMIQDMLYLQTCARLKMMAVAAAPDFDDVEVFEIRHKSSLEYVTSSKEICITMLGIPETAIKTTPRSVELDAIDDHDKASLRTEDALLAYYVVLLPCILTYWRIAERLMNDPSTAKNVVYHPAWTVVNYDSSSVAKYTKFINANIAAKGGINRWNDTFKIACELEAKLFNTGLPKHASSTPFHIVPDGTYSLHMSTAESVVLAIQNVKGFLRPPLDKLLGGYFPSDAASVVGTNETGGENERWHVVATKAGYTFKNMGTDLYLAMSVESHGKEGRILQAALEPYYWWINPVSTQPAQESPVYQIYDSVNLRYTLHADMEVLNNIGSTNFPYTPIIAHENSEASCQMWLFNDGAQTAKEPRTKKPRKAKLSKAERILLREAAESDRQEARAKEEEQRRLEVAMAVQARKEREAPERERRARIQAMGAQVCHWELFTGAFYAASFKPTPIKFGVRNGLPTYVGRTRTAYIEVKDYVESIRDLQDRMSFNTLLNSNPGSYVQVLVGDQSRLCWVSCHGRLELKSIGHTPVCGWENEAGDAYTWYIARFSHLGNVYVTGHKTYMDGVSEWVDKRIVRTQDYEVLCYKNF
ncbi:hypothetical protein B0H14DRAFT_1346388 [Mycena olivaceomarginata]|nr:hypothetical protein B0H14DRAFT_1346388 [Mycena olivaceomarginata]